MTTIAVLGWLFAATFAAMWLVTEYSRRLAHDGWRKSLDERRKLIEQLDESIKRERRTLLAYLGDRAIRSAFIGEPWEDQ